VEEKGILLGRGVVEQGRTPHQAMDSADEARRGRRRRRRFRV